MYHPAMMSLSTLPALNGSSPEELQQQTFMDSLQRTATKSLLLSPFTFTRAFSPATLALLQTGGGGTVSPLVHHSSQSLGNYTCPDFTGLLPTEIMVYILLHLAPQDLCSVSAVCSRWYQLAQYGVLDRRRKVYVQCRREQYQLSKENCTPGPPNSRAPTTTAPSPLGHVQPLSPLSTSQPSSTIWESPGSHTSNPTLIAPPPLLSLYTSPYQLQPTSPPPINHMYTPSPTLLVDDVKFLSLDDNQDILLYRPLSPDLRWVESTLYSLRQVATRKNKNRLRRL